MLHVDYERLQLLMDVLKVLNKEMVENQHKIREVEREITKMIPDGFNHCLSSISGRIPHS